jgi:hypothetical protein
MFFPFLLMVGRSRNAPGQPVIMGLRHESASRFQAALQQNMKGLKSLSRALADMTQAAECASRRL